jgi:hypothetical protein
MECVGFGNCLISDGQPCTGDAACAAGLCKTYYQDADGDGYDVGSALLCGTAPPVGWSATTQGTDCCDADSRVHPGQTAYFTTAITGACARQGTFDYDCANGDEKQYPDGNVPVAICEAAAPSWYIYRCFYGIGDSSGFDYHCGGVTSTVPACGTGQVWEDYDDTYDENCRAISPSYPMPCR